ncbi:hypothetical protein KDA_49620 [Dictyobacter alpinus]|uniref:Uncharacterized protein n=1 Tax=Dictyobacter alpinus TaxID=2014873 RepID=A0A402BDJ6_9CHLR|nr:hypothetical protein KDA_49620 [Dictyobacter alpinus]
MERMSRGKRSTYHCLEFPIAVRTYPYLSLPSPRATPLVPLYSLVLIVLCRVWYRESVGRKRRQQKSRWHFGIL